jgi:hypothetical protein
MVQYGGDGSSGKGPLEWTSENKTELIQTFTKPDGAQYKEAHKTVLQGNDKYTGTSYSITESGEWIERRTYTWTKT